MLAVCAPAHSRACDAQRAMALRPVCVSWPLRPNPTRLCPLRLVAGWRVLVQCSVITAVSLSGIVTLFISYQRQHVFIPFFVEQNPVVPASQCSESCPPWLLESVNVIYPSKYVDGPLVLNNIPKHPTGKPEKSRSRLRCMGNSPGDEVEKSLRAADAW